MKEKEKNSGKGEKKGLEEVGKENQKKEVRSALGKAAYTENTMRDLSKRI